MKTVAVRGRSRCRRARPRRRRTAKSAVAKRTWLRVDAQPVDALSLVLLRAGWSTSNHRHSWLRVAERSTVVARADDRRLRHPSIEGGDHDPVEERRSSREVLAERRPGVDRPMFEATSRASASQLRGCRRRRNRSNESRGSATFCAVTDGAPGLTAPHCQIGRSLQAWLIRCCRRSPSACSG